MENSPFRESPYSRMEKRTNKFIDYDMRKYILKEANIEKCRRCEEGMKFPNCELIFTGRCSEINRRITDQGKLVPIIVKINQ